MRHSSTQATRLIPVALLALLLNGATGSAEEPFEAPRRADENRTATRQAGWIDLAGAGVGSMATPAASCEDASACPRKWSVRVMPYGWVPGFDGDLTVRNVTTPVDVSVGKSLDIVVNHFDFAALGQIEATNGLFGFIFNGLYVNVSPGGEVRRLNFSSNLAITILDLTATVNLDRVPEALGLPEGSRFELLAGTRFVSLSSGLTVTGPRGNSASDSGTDDWFDPIVGCRFRVPLTQCLTAQVRGDVGGFGIGEASRFTWNIETTLEYRCSDRCSLIGGYRWLDIDHVSGSGTQRFGFDMNLNGPIVGLAFDF